MDQGAWRTDILDFDDRPIYQFVLLEGYQEHSGKLWHRQWAGTAIIANGEGSRFGYRCEDIDRIQRDGDMIVAERVKGWLPMKFPRFDLFATAPEPQPHSTDKEVERGS